MLVYKELQFGLVISVRTNLFKSSDFKSNFSFIVKKNINLKYLVSFIYIYISIRFFRLTELAVRVVIFNMQL